MMPFLMDHCKINVPLFAPQQGIARVFVILATCAINALAINGSLHLSKREHEKVSNVLQHLHKLDDPAQSRKQNNWFFPRTKRPPTVYVRRTTPRPTFSPDACDRLPKHSRVEQADPYSQIVCLRLNQKELVGRLKDAGGLAKRYAAVNASGACSFEDLTTDAIQKPEPKLPTASRRYKTTPATAKDSHDQAKKRRRRMRRALPKEPGTVLRGCQGRGTRVDSSNNFRLCTECSATTRLPNSVFPQYINEVVCKDTDLMCAARMGICVQKILKLSFVRRTGKFEKDAAKSLVRGIEVYKEVWEEYTQIIRSCCECTVFPSVLNSFASKSAAETTNGL